MMFDRRAFCTLLGATALTVVGGKRLRAADLATIRYVHSTPAARPYHSYSYAGEPAGLYAKIGLKPDFNFISGSAAAMQLLVSGDADLANVGILEYISARQKQPTLPLSMVYCEDYNSSYVLVVPEDSAIKTLADFKGKSIGVLSLGSGSVSTTKAMLRKAGVDPAGVQILAVGADAQALAALRSGVVEGLSYFIGSIAGLENTGMKFRYFTADIPSGIFVASRTGLTRNRDLIVRGCQGIALSTAYSEIDPIGAAKGYQTLFGKPGVAQTVLEQDAHTITRTMSIFKQVDDKRLWGQMTKDDWQRLIAFTGADFGLDANTDMGQFFDDSLIADINKLDIVGLARAAKT